MDKDKKLSFIINIAYYLLLFAIVWLFVQYALPVLTPFLLGFLIAAVMRRPTRFFTRKFHLPHKPVALAMVLLFYCTIGLLITLIILRAVAGIENVVAFIPTFYTQNVLPIFNAVFNRVESLIQEMSPSAVELVSGMGDQLIKSLNDLITRLSGSAVSAASNFAAAIPGIFIKTVLMIISSFFFAADFDVLTGFCLKQLSDTQKDLFHQIREYIIGTLFVCLRSYLLIMFITFVELSIGLSLMKISYPILIAALIAIFDILPVLGTGGVMIPWSVITLLYGNYLLAFGLLLLYVIITVIRNIIEPKIVGKQLGLHPVVTLISMFVGLQLLNIIGMFGFPILISLVRYLQSNGVIKPFKS